MIGVGASCLPTGAVDAAGTLAVVTTRAQRASFHALPAKKVESTSLFSPLCFRDNAQSTLAVDFFHVVRESDEDARSAIPASAGKSSVRSASSASRPSPVASRRSTGSRSRARNSSVSMKSLRSGSPSDSKGKCRQQSPVRSEARQSSRSRGRSRRPSPARRPPVLSSESRPSPVRRSKSKSRPPSVNRGRSRRTASCSQSHKSSIGSKSRSRSRESSPSAAPRKKSVTPRKVIAERGKSRGRSPVGSASSKSRRRSPVRSVTSASRKSSRKSPGCDMSRRSSFKSLRSSVSSGMSRGSCTSRSCSSFGSSASESDCGGYAKRKSDPQDETTNDDAPKKQPKYKKQDYSQQPGPTQSTPPVGQNHANTQNPIAQENKKDYSTQDYNLTQPAVNQGYDCHYSMNTVAHAYGPGSAGYSSGYSSSYGYNGYGYNPYGYNYQPASRYQTNFQKPKLKNVDRSN